MTAWGGKLGWALLALILLLVPAPPALALEDVDPLRDPIQLLDMLEKKRQELDERAKWLELRETELKRLEDKIAKRITALESLRDQIQKDMVREKEVDNTNIARLAKIYTGMKDKDAAAELQILDKETAVRVLKVMREKVAAKILAKMPPQQGAALAEELGIPINQRRQMAQ